jgi:multiple sugar transport system permease protein
MERFTTRSDKMLLTVFYLTVSVVGVLILLPVLHAIHLSFFNARSFVDLGEFVWLDNYVRMLGERQFWYSLGIGVVFAGAAIILQVVLGIGLALLLNRPFRGRALLRGAIVLPYLLPTVVIAITLHWLLDGTVGLFTHLAMDAGLGRPAWFSSTTSALTIVVLASVWTWTPFVTICFLAALQTVPTSLYEAARVDGAGAWTRFWHITIPVLKPVLIVIVLLRSIWMFNKFDVVWLISGGGPMRSTEHLPVLAYRRAFSEFDVGGGAAVATLSFIILSVLIALYFWRFPIAHEERT